MSRSMFLLSVCFFLHMSLQSLTGSAVPSGAGIRAFARSSVATLDLRFAQAEAGRGALTTETPISHLISAMHC